MNNITQWDDIFKEIETSLKIYLPTRLKNWIKNKFNPPTKK
jgi:hypothetical protein